MGKSLYAGKIGTGRGAAAMVKIGETPVKTQRRNLRDFRSFPSEAEQGVDAPFRENVKGFLFRYAWMSPPSSMSRILPNLTSWRMSFALRDESNGRKGGEEEDAPPIVDLVVVVEEDVARAKAVYCDQCRVVGWSEVPVCAKRYHFIIPVDVKAMERPSENCVRCSSSLDISDMRCHVCNLEVLEDDIEDWAFQLLEDYTHLLHGVVHSNGCGHLLRVNGREGGSNFLKGRDIMDFWDRLCLVLRVRKVTVMDISKKYGLEYRLLHAVTAGRPWYGEWGYEFGTGSFAINAKAYAAAIDNLSNLPLSIFFSHCRSPRSQIQNVLAFYQSLADKQLLTIGDILRFILRLIHESRERIRTESTARKTHLQANHGILCAWTMEDVNVAEEAVFKILKSVPKGVWISLRALKGAISHDIRSIELIDYCLKGINGKTIVDNMVVAVRCNPDTDSIEYRLQVATERSSNFHFLESLSEDHLIRDLKLLYDALLNPYTMHSYKPEATRKLAIKSATILLDCKRFIKNYDRFISAGINSNSLHISCEIELLDQPKDSAAIPTELLVLPQTATISHLKFAAAKAFQEVYIIYQKFEVEKLEYLEKISDSTNVRLLLGQVGSVKVKGRCPSDNRLTQFRKERGTERWIVECLCGATDDDGERMVACDLCGVWTHTRCIGVSDLDEVPKKFVCMKCSRRRSSGAKKAQSAPIWASNKRIKRVNNEFISSVDNDIDKMQSQSFYEDASNNGNCTKHLIKGCTSQVENCGIPSWLETTKISDCDERDMSIEGSPLSEVIEYSDPGDQTSKNIALLPSLGNRTGVVTIPDVQMEDVSSCEGLTSNLSTTMQETCAGSSNPCKEEISNVTRKEFTDRSCCRCTDGMASPITDVGIYVTMTCK